MDQDLCSPIPIKDYKKSSALKPGVKPSYLKKSNLTQAGSEIQVFSSELFENDKLMLEDLK
ncbi:hypothetical protein SS50377_28693 [Spironucleus salmonicida]|uniref:Uncharacterized protein n=1 Tax=Spironucleus salmonicida TaxID=348837 RepID=V6LIH5_9EUKA|nr:hypothetical protein SS50377_28693 [Spironucleus salmonicida]|eukprot:EST44342.1 Hypothetical protein SS50377_15812 [Spironucleus salmonicida]